MPRHRNSLFFALLVISSAFLFVTFFIKQNPLSNMIPSDMVINYPSSTDLQSLRSTTKSYRNCPGTVIYEKYCVISPYEEEFKNISRSGLVTLTTQGTAEFLKHVVVLCHRWSAPISVAVYSPEKSYIESRITVHLLRQCNACVRYWVNWHFFLDKKKIPHLEEFRLIKECSSINELNKPRKRNFQGTYPINVGRNIARRNAHTPFLFSIDIELYPSLNIPQKFEQMLRSQVSNEDNEVWVLPVFEVHPRTRAPMNKNQLRSMFAKKLAISFHKYRCNSCHRIPNLTQWISLEDKANSEIDESLEALRIFSTVKRNRRFNLQMWEPFFIGTKKDPEFDIRLSWEGKQNKMQMAYEMCMKNYDFHIVENAFLVHTPGINVYNRSKEKDRMVYAPANVRILRKVMKDLTAKYGNKNNC